MRGRILAEIVGILKGTHLLRDLSSFLSNLRELYAFFIYFGLKHQSFIVFHHLINVSFWRNELEVKKIYQIQNKVIDEMCISNPIGLEDYTFIHSNFRHCI